MSSKTILLVDPPGGWKYNFPMPIPPDRVKDVRAFLVERGYPQWEIDNLGDNFYVRFFEQEINNEE
jgi:hypothetical protein